MLETAIVVSSLSLAAMPSNNRPRTSASDDSGFRTTKSRETGLTQIWTNGGGHQGDTNA